MGFRGYVIALELNTGEIVRCNSKLLDGDRLVDGKASDYNQG